jgi:putative phosphoribosyl transferase
MMTRREVSFPASDGVRVRGELYLPRRARALVVFVHGSGTTRHDEQNEQLARHLQQRGFGTLLIDLLADYETSDRHNVFDIGLQAQRLIHAVRWLRAVELHCDTLPLGYFGTGVGAGVVLIAAARAPELACALITRGGRPDTAADYLPRVSAPTLFIADEPGAVPDWVELAFQRCASDKEKVCVDSPSHLYREPEAAQAVAEHAERWFTQHLTRMARPGCSPQSPRPRA